MLFSWCAGSLLLTRSISKAHRGGSFYALADGKVGVSDKLVTAAVRLDICAVLPPLRPYAQGSFAFVATLTGWWLLLSLISSRCVALSPIAGRNLISCSVNGPVIPCGDLSKGLPWKKTKKTV